ncbi:MAG: hypothetical protein KKF46_07450 [Nanoarchaeota archaeon]|nr:hypothetical protein [Nanoarchaeota archaeon]MBU1322162.1 hypothetical protein [Nanoarchaeota archaeon]MBU1597883.1 hypothetical protein [Nanoarchaeota archaeon]MBU2441302.1 hypothetical protein [Nanoarchaeota archaeon]
MVEPTLFPREVSPEKHIKKQSADADLFGRISKTVNSVAANLRILEERYSTLRSKSQVSEQNIIELEKELSTDIKSISEDVVDLKREVNDVKDKIRLISNEIKNLANKNDFKVIERYLDMWQPMNFVTRAEINKLLAEKQGKKPD